MAYEKQGFRQAVAIDSCSQINAYINDSSSYLTFNMLVAIIRDVDLHRCRRPEGGTQEQPSGIENAAAPLESFFNAKNCSWQTKIEW